MGVDELRFLAGASVSSSQKLIEWIEKLKDMVDLKSTVNKTLISKLRSL